ncbi:MAG TPA: MFS transporter [Solirubrobacteraceae bacterium]|nr:MFS transporter [Solirubrobacteraceae bacterium]
MSPRARLAALLPALRSADFRALFGGQVVSLVGDAIYPIALAFAVLDLGGSPGALGLVLAAQGITLTALVLVAGVWADRLPRQRLMLASDLGRGVVQAVTATLLISGRAEIWHLAVLAAAYGAFEAAFRPAAGGLLPQIVDGEHLQQANALMGLALNAGMVLGPALAGTLIALTGPGSAIAIDAATFAISAAFLVRIRAPRPERTPSDDGQEGFWAELRGGVGEVAARRWLWTFLPGLMAYQLIALPGVLALGPVVADRDLGGPAAWGAITAAFGVGTILGNVAALRIRPSRPMFVATLAFIGCSTQPIAIALGDSTAVIAGLLLLGGIAVSFGFGQYETTLGREIPPQALGRVTSLDYFVTGGALSLGFAVVGPVAALVGTQATLVAAGLITMALFALAATVPDVRHLKRRAVPV